MIYALLGAFYGAGVVAVCSYATCYGFIVGKRVRLARMALLALLWPITVPAIAIWVALP